jgi:4'-phosphopantetheinyl transferase EntD
VFERLLPPEVIVAETTSGASDAAVRDLFPEEQAAVASAVDKRRREFALGRSLARRALAELGQPPTPLLHGDDRAPVWPAGFVGSITHTQGLCAAAVTRRGSLRSVGIDAERDVDLATHVLATICDAEERAWLATQPEASQGRLAKLVFSIKECVYKVQYPLSATFLDFSAVRVDVDTNAGRWTATFLEPAGGVFAIGDTVAGKWLRAGGLLLTAATLREPSERG